MPTFTITEVSDNVRAYDTDYGPKKAYRVHLRNGDGTDHLNIEFRRNADSTPPTVGQQLEGDLIDQGQYGQRLQVAQRAGGGWSGSRPEDPKKSAHIARMHAQEMALRLFDIQVRRGVVEASVKSSDYLPSLIDWFTEDAEKARDDAS